MPLPAPAQKKSATAQRNPRGLGTAIAIGAVLLLILGLFALWQSLRDRADEKAKAAPANATSKYGALLGTQGAPHEIVIYEDFLCSHCADFEAASSDVLSQAIAAGTATVEYRPFNLLGGHGDYSPRAVNAWAVVLDSAGPDVAKEFHDLLFANQPTDPTAVSDDRFVELASQSGATAANIRDGIRIGRFEQWVSNATDQASKDGVTQTPTVLIDGQEVTPDPAAIEAALERAAGTPED